jgi:hypothetical protein
MSSNSYDEAEQLDIREGDVWDTVSDGRVKIIKQCYRKVMVSLVRFGPQYGGTMDIRHLTTLVERKDGDDASR